MKTMLGLLICTHLEGLLEPLGWHIGMTGSTLYGPSPEKGDLDVIIYPHIDPDGKRVSALSPEEVLEKVGITDVEHIEGDFDAVEYSGLVDYIYCGKINGGKIDAFFLS